MICTGQKEPRLWRAGIKNAIHPVRSPRPGPLYESNFAISAYDLLAETPEPVDYVLDEYLPPGALVLIAGKPKEGKTTLVYEAAVAIAKGTPFLGRTTKKSGVLILAVEEHRREVRARLHNLGADDLQHLYLKIGPLTPSPTLFAEIRDFIQANDIQLVVLDTLGAFWKVDNENDAAQVTKAVKPLLQLARESGACVVLIHHARKSEGSHGDEIRGSGALFGLVDIGLVMKRHQVENQRLLQAQSRYAETPKELVLELRDSGYVAIGDPASVGKTAKLEKLMATLPQDWEDAIKIRTRAGLSSPQETHRLLTILVKEEKALREGKGVKGDPYRFKRNSIHPTPPVYRDESNSETDEVTNSIHPTPPSPCTNGNHAPEAPLPSANAETSETGDTPATKPNQTKGTWCFFCGESMRGMSAEQKEAHPKEQTLAHLNAWEEMYESVAVNGGKKADRDKAKKMLAEVRRVRAEKFPSCTNENHSQPEEVNLDVD